MVILNDKPPKRPPCCQFESMAALYVRFELLLAETGGKIESKCGHVVHVFDHHIFHMAGITRPPLEILSMPGEKAEIRATTEGYGRFVLAHGGSRARNLPSAFRTISDPDEVWLDNPSVATAKWVYVKQFDSAPCHYTVALLGDRPAQGGIIVPFSSFQCKSRDLKKWRDGTCVYRKQIQPPEGG